MTELGHGRDSVRVATFNVALDRPAAGDLTRELLQGGSAQLENLAEIIQRVRPDILLLCEFDHDGEGRDERGLHAFCDRYLAQSWHGSTPIHYPVRRLLATNTGELLPCDLDGDGVIRAPRDCFGFGDFHGQYGMALLSRFPLDDARVRSFRHFPWARMPGARLPRRWSPPLRELMRLSSKNHLDLPLLVGSQVLHLLAMHPTPPVFNPINRARNHDEVRLFYDYLDGADYLVDDAGQVGGLAPGEPFVLLGDFNADPCDGDGERSMIRRLLTHPRVQGGTLEGARVPRSGGGLAFAAGRPPSRGEPACWTQLRPLRLDYVLPSRECRWLDSGVFWPAPGDPLRYLCENADGEEGKRVSSDHRLVWIDLQLPHAVNQFAK